MSLVVIRAGQRRVGVNYTDTKCFCYWPLPCNVKKLWHSGVEMLFCDGGGIFSDLK